MKFGSRLLNLRRRVRATVPGRWAAARRHDLSRLLAGRAHRRWLRRADPSYAGEWPCARGLLSRLDMLRAGYAVDIGAGDGARHSVTLPLFRDHGWGGLAVESDATRFRRLRRSCANHAGVAAVRARVDPANVVELLLGCQVPLAFEFLNVDIDSFDLAIVRAVLDRFAPAVIDLEINEKVPPPVRFEVLHTPDHVWDGSHFYGCSLAAAVDALDAREYRLAGLQFNNAFFVRGDLASAAAIESADVSAAFRRGYVDRPARERLFPWNADVDFLLSASPDDVVAALAERFRRQRGRYRIGLDSLEDGAGSRAIA